MPDSTPAWRLRETIWDALNRKTSVSESVALPFAVPGVATPPSSGELAFAPASKTTFVYDYAGRPVTVTAPDHNVTTTAYTADAGVIRTLSNIATANGPQNAVTTELYDGAGRLASVEESADQNNGNITTQYQYHVGGRFTHAGTTLGTGGPTRDFTYDPPD